MLYWRVMYAESRKRKARNWDENDYYDSDDDTFLDRTGDIEKKRQMRMKRAGKLKDGRSEAALTYDQLVPTRDQSMNSLVVVDSNTYVYIASRRWRSWRR